MPYKKSEKSQTPEVSKSKTVDFNYFHFLFYFYFLFNLFSYFSIFRTSVRVRVMISCCHTSVIPDDMVIVIVTSYRIQGRI